jgi:hypothetical protein
MKDMLTVHLLIKFMTMSNGLLYLSVCNSLW